jgi:tetratricopeptide (TPR) repeat protein
MRIADPEGCTEGAAAEQLDERLMGFSLNVTLAAPAKLAGERSKFIAGHQQDRLHVTMTAGQATPGARRLRHIVAVVVLTLTTTACNRAGEGAAERDPAALVAFHTAVAALEVGDDARADARFAEVTRLAPGEAAAWANWGILALRQGNLEQAQARIAKSVALAPKEARLRFLDGVIASRSGRTGDAVAAFRAAVERAPDDARAAYSLALELEREGSTASDAAAAAIIRSLAARHPENLALQLELARAEARGGDRTAVQAALARLLARGSAWPPEVQEQFAPVQALADAGDLRAVSARMTRLRNALGRIGEYREGLALLKAPAGMDAQPLELPLTLTADAARPAPADAKLRFEPQARPAGSGKPRQWAGAIYMDDSGRPLLAEGDGTEILIDGGRATLPFPGGAAHTPPSAEGVLQIDFSYDFKTDLVLAGAGGLRLWQQQDGGTFKDVTASSRLPASVTSAAYSGAWAADIDADGDLDVIVAAEHAPPSVLRNNGDGTFTTIVPFPGVVGISQLAWLDLDGDGVGDVALIDEAGRLRVFMNRRQGRFVERSTPAGAQPVAAIATGDANRRGGFDLFVVQADGTLARWADFGPDGRWEVTRLTTVPPAWKLSAASVRLRVADLDNNGLSDLVLSRTRADGAAAPSLAIWLGQPDGSYAPLAAPTFAGVFDVADSSGAGRLDLIGLDPAGRLAVAASVPSLAYHWQTIRPRAAQAFGDQRINPFAIGGSVEVRAGTQVQRVAIVRPVVHFGLGERSQVDVARVFWPNGVIQAEFDLKGDQSIAAEQRLKGSCPYMFAFDGEHMSFVKDTVPWGSAIGLRINNLGSASVAATEEWYKIAGSQLVARDGEYDIRITGELWEVYYYDFLTLTGVDHPEGTEVYVDERFVIPPVPLAVTVVEAPHPLRAARDDQGQDVSALLRDLDGSLLDSFGRGQYQGVAREHYVELELGDDAPSEGPLYLVAHGSLRPTDSSINVALSQGSTWVPHGLVLEVADGRGGWKIANDNLGFPAGRKKTVLIDLAGVFSAGAPRRVRLRTNLEIYWDQIQWARGLPKTALRTFEIPLLSAALRYRGYSAISAPPAGAPEIPDYGKVVSTRQRWRDLAGFYTRYGDVRELLRAADDRYVIMNAGDEMALRFQAAPAVEAGWKRDFVVKGDGWIKDGDYNSTFSASVLPLPHHGERDYRSAPGRLEDEWTYRHHPDDWLDYHTRYIDSMSASRALTASQP